LTTAVDTSVLVDVLWGDPQFGPASRSALVEAERRGAIVVSPVVVAELRSAYTGDDELKSVLSDLRIQVVPFDTGDALLAGSTHRAYRRAGGTRARIIADFLIAAHAANHADRLLARDRGFYRIHFDNLNVHDPSQADHSQQND